jgi:hypothetical protein
MAEESVLDFADLGSAVVDAPVVETAAPVVDAPVVEADAPVVNADAPAVGADKKEAKTQYNSDGSPKEAAAKGATKAEDLPGTDKTPKEIRNSLKALRDLDPSHAQAVKQLHGAFERWEAAKQIFPGGVKEMQTAKEFSDLIGGAEGYETLTGVKAAAEASDAKLYEGNVDLIKDIEEDLKSTGHLDALGKLAPSFLDAVKRNDSKAFDAAIAPHVLSMLETDNLPGVIAGLEQALSDPDPAKAIAAAKELITGKYGIKQWYEGLSAENKKQKAAVLSPEKQALDKERADFVKQQADFKTNQTTVFKNSVASVCEKANNTLLGTQLKPFLKMPYFQGYGKENLVPLGNTIKNNLYAALKADTVYQAQMKSMWAAKEPDRAKIEEYHRTRVESIAEETVRSTVQRMYPNYTKGGAAAGRIAAAADKKAVDTKVEQKAVTSGKPIYVAQKPSREALDMDHVDKSGKPDAVIEMINGRGFLKGSGKWVTWRK